MMPFADTRIHRREESGLKDDNEHSLDSESIATSDGEDKAQDNFSELERRFMAIDLGLISLQRPLEDICTTKATFYAYSKHTSSVWHHSCGPICQWASLPSCASNDEPLAVDTKLIEEDLDQESDLAVGYNNSEPQPRVQQSMNKLPIELWAQIFYMCLPSDSFITPDPRQAPLLLCQICTSWRTIATGTPLLWSALAVRGSWCLHNWKSSLECWLKRAGNAVLYLDISIPLYMEPIFSCHVQKLILASADRWHHLRLSLTNPLLCSMLNKDMPALRTLEFSSPYPLTSLCIRPSQVPNLKSVSLLTKSLYIQPLSLPWSRLTNLSSQCWLNIRQHLDILRKCPKLESYSMRVVDAEMAHTIQPHLMHPLRVLEIIPFMGSAIGPVLNCLQLPNLTELTFVVPDESPSYGMTTWPSTHVFSLIERSSCPLAKLCLRGIIVSEESIISIENTCHSLTSIERR